MKAFDFDGTLYDGDSSLDFFIFCLLHHLCCMRYLPKQISGLLRFVFKRISREEYKECFFSFLSGLDNVDLIVHDFWQKKIRKLKPSIVDLVEVGDLIISASPEFLLTIPSEKMGANLIATQINPKTGVMSGKNCRGREKVSRCLDAGYRNFDAFYSDSYVDRPMMKKAKRSYLVKGEKIIEIK